ncbi:MAG: cupredoxin domain-containing protein [Chloroflexi bacterium]|nr:cupredoxin domain-containing protein [Chloroflexota bacterium]
MPRFRLLDTVRRTAALLMLALGLFALSVSPTLAADAEVIVVEPSDVMSWRYDPSTLTIEAGTTVTWTNQGSTAVTITSPDGLFDSDTLAPGASYSYTFDTPGTFRYFCVPYPHMKGLVVVTR